MLHVADPLLEVHNMEFIRELILERKHKCDLKNLNTNLVVHQRIYIREKPYSWNNGYKL